MTICSYDNSGQLKFDVDIEMAQGYWNTSSSRLWTRIRDLMHDELVAKYNNMRQNGLSYESLMECFYDEQIAKIPQKYYNQDYDVKYAPFADSYIGMANGDTYEHLKRWLQQRLRFVDSLYDYAPSYNNDVLTIRANTTKPMTLEIETYTPVYQHLSWYNNQMDKKKIDGKTSVTFTGTAMAETDQEVLIYGGSNIKSIKGITSMNPNRMLIGSATKLIELDAPNCPLLADINANKANLAPHTYLNKVNLSGCPLLGGNLIINQSPLIRKIDIRNTAITGLNLSSNLRNLEILRLPANIPSLILNDASQLHTLEFEESGKLQNVSMTNCNALTNVINFDLSTAQQVTLNNSYNTINELYLKNASTLSLRNMSNLEKVIYTPNAEHEVFDITNLANTKDYNITTFNCPKLNTFMTTAPYRESYGKEYGEVKPNEVFEANTIDISNTQFTDVKLLCTTDTNVLKLPQTVKNLIIDSAYDLDTTYLTDGDYSTIHADLYEPYNTNYEEEVLLNGETPNIIPSASDGSIIQSMYVPSKTVQPASGVWDLKGLELDEYHTFGLNNDVKLVDDTLTMPNRYDEYSIQIKNATIPNEIARYTASDWNTFPTFNSEFIYTYDITKLNDEAYEYSIMADSMNNLPTSIGFNGKSSLLTVEYLNVNNVTNMNSMFRNCNNLISLDVSNWDTGKVTNMGYMFYNCQSLTTLDLSNFDTQNVTNMGIMFYGCKNLTSLDLSSWDTSKVTNMGSMFDNCLSLTSLGVSNFNTSNVTVMNNMFYNCTNLTSLDLSNFNTSKVTNMNGMFASCDKLTSIDVSNWDTSNVTAMGAMFYSCKNLTSLDASNFDTSKVTNMNSMFQNCTNLTSIDVSNWNTSNVTAMGAMFYSCNNLISLDVSNWDTSNVTDMNAMFRACKTLTSLDVSNFNTNNVTNMGSMFYGCNNLTSLDVSNWDTSNVTIMDYMFLECKSLTSLDVSNFNTSKVTNMGYMFNNCTNLTSLDVSNWDTSNVTIMDYMFNSCNNLTSLDLSNFNTSKVTNMGYMFNNCTNLTSLDVSNFNTSNVTNMSAMFQSCTSLQELHIESWTLNDITQTGVSTLPVGDDEKNEIYTNAYFTIPNGWTLINILEIARYTTNTSGVLPTFNNEYSGYSTQELENEGIYTVRIVTNSLDNLPTSISFNGKSELLTVEYLNVDNVTTMYYMFQNCTNLTSLDVSGFDTINATNMQGMFQNCQNLTSLDLSNFDTSEVTTMSYMFYNCTNLTSLDVSNFNTSNVTYMSSMFQSCSSLISLDVSNFNTSKVTSMAQMFRGCNKLTSLDVNNFVTSNVTDMNSMFNGCSNLTLLDVNNFVTSNVTDMNSMFNGCSNLTLLDLSSWDNSKVTNMQSMFHNCKLLTSLDLSNFNTNKVTNMFQMFYGCNNLTTLDLSNFNTSNVTSMGSMFTNCTNLTSLDSMQNIPVSLSLSATKLDQTSLVDVINNLATVTTAQTLTLGTTLLAKLTEEQIAIAVNKGWTVA